MNFAIIECNYEMASMRWLENFDLFLFDLDGLLVNTEWLHYAAYKEMLAARGYDIGIDFNRYFQFAQSDAKALQHFVYDTFPELKKIAPDWQELYQEKKAAILRILDSTQVPLMPGVEKLLQALSETDKRACVVTHSQLPLVDRLRRQQPILSVIKNWITREDYEHPKPAPDGYLQAIKRYALPGDRIIGFEDSERGMRALMDTHATAIFINDMDPIARARFQAAGVRAYKTFDELFVEDLHKK